MDSKKLNGTYRPERGQACHSAGTRRYGRAAMRRKRRRRKQILAGLIAVSLGSAAILGCNLFGMYREEWREAEVQYRLQDAYRAVAETIQPTLAPVPTIAVSMTPEQVQNAAEEIQSSPQTPTPDPIITVSITPESSGTDIPVFPQKEEPTVNAQLKEFYDVNPDLIGWIQMGEIVNGPVVIRDNSYYLSRDFYGNSSKSGTIFADEENADWQEHPYMVLYGHNMRDNTMFGRVDQLKNVDDFRQNTLIEFQMLYDDEPRYYLPFAVVDASVKTGEKNYFWLRRFDIFSGETRDEQKIDSFIAEIMSRSSVKVPGLDVTHEDNILCLVTCSYTSDEARIMVFCREIRENEDAAGMSESISMAVTQND